MIYTLTPAEGCFPGVHRHLSELQQFGTEHIYLNQLNQLNQVTENDSIIFGAWDPNSYPMAIRRCKAKRKALLFTSPLLQAQMNDPELSFLETILDLQKKDVINYLLFADKETYEVFKADGIYHLPHPADVSNVEKYKEDIPKESIFCFMPWGNKNKNQACQLAAVKLFQRNNPTIMLYTNGMCSWQHWADRLQIAYIDQGYLPKDQYYKEICKRRCGIHVTLSESFAYGVLDSFLLGVPVVCSPAINWAPPSLIVSNPDDPVEIADKLDKIYNENNPSYGKAARKFAVNKIEDNNEKAKKLIETIFS